MEPCAGAGLSQWRARCVEGHGRAEGPGGRITSGHTAVECGSPCGGAAQLLRQETAIGALVGTLAQKDALLEVQGEALHYAETALEERGAALLALQQQADVARAQLEKEKERTEGKCL